MDNQPPDETLKKTITTIETCKNMLETFVKDEKRDLNFSGDYGDYADKTGKRICIYR